MIFNKKFWPLYWLIIMISIFIMSIFNYKPYFIMCGSTSIAPLMNTLINNYFDNHKKADFIYNSLGSDAAIMPIEKNMFGIGWMSKEYINHNSNLILFFLSNDGIILIYNLPKKYLGNNQPLNFTKNKVKQMYLNKSSILWKDLFPKNNLNPNQGWIKSICNLKILPYTRENGSGTREVFNEKVLDNKQEYYSKVITVNSATQMFNMSNGGVGYSSYSDKKQINNNKFINIYIAKWENITPSLEVIKNPNIYNLVRPFVGLINKKFKKINILINFLKFLFYDNYPGHKKYVNLAFSENYYAQVPILLNNNLNYELKIWLNKFS